MRPVLFKWRGITVWSYPAMLYLGLVFGVIAGNVAAHAAGLDALRVYIATLILIVPALAGARLLYVAAEWPSYRRNLRRIWDRNDGGASMYGGLPVALLVSVPLLRVLHIDFAAFWDVAVFTILVGMFFTRIGCLLNGCCSGCRSDSWLAWELPNREGIRERRIPTQLLEATWAVALLAGAIVLWRTGYFSHTFPGALFLLAAFGYAGGRLLMECARERGKDVSRFSVAHAISLGIALLSFSSLFVFWHK